MVIREIRITKLDCREKHSSLGSFWCTANLSNGCFVESKVKVFGGGVAIDLLGWPHESLHASCSRSL